MFISQNRHLKQWRMSHTWWDQEKEGEPHNKLPSPEQNCVILSYNELAGVKKQKWKTITGWRKVETSRMVGKWVWSERALGMPSTLSFPLAIYPSWTQHPLPPKFHNKSIQNGVNAKAGHVGEWVVQRKSSISKQPGSSLSLGLDVQSH